MSNLATERTPVETTISLSILKRPGITREGLEEALRIIEEILPGQKVCREPNNIASKIEKATVFTSLP